MNTSVAAHPESASVETPYESGDVRAGLPQPWGAHQRGDGVNFTVFSRHATRVRLEFYRNATDGEPSRTIDLDPIRNRTGDVWHVWVRGLAPGQLYAYRIDGPYRPEEGHRFNVHKLLLDPFATAIAGVPNWDFVAAQGYDPSHPADELPSTRDNASTTPKCVFSYSHFDWEDDRPPKHASSDAVVYEVHVRGFTIHPSSSVSRPGTFLGLTEKIPYFKDLGVTAVELMPVQEFNEKELVRFNPRTKEPLRNYWGYNPVSFYAPKESYAGRGQPAQQILEFQEMVKAFHRADIEVILDVVLNHTAEGNQLGPTISLRGVENSIFYLLQENDRRYYKDFSGVGNTLNANHPVVREFVMEALRHWVMRMHVDGFRFDLASILGRDEHGNILQNAPLLESIAEDPILHDVKISAEAWDAGGAYQVGSFSRHRWAEWNGRFRDDVRRFWLGDAGMMGPFAARLCGSADLYQASDRGPETSINFVTAHDGFTLNDLVSYSQKHNEENGEYNRDGTDANYSENCGVEGPSSDPGVEGLRRRLIKNFLLTLFVSRGIPLLLGGDEFRRTQRGNNNAYCQDNDVSWIDWSRAAQEKETYRFTRGMIAFRRAHQVLRREAFYSDAEIKWFGPHGEVPEWNDPWQKSFACLLLDQSAPDLFLMFNAHSEPADFSVPALQPDKVWRLAVNTAAPAPQDFYEPGTEPALQVPGRFRLEPRSSAILLARSRGA